MCGITGLLQCDRRPASPVLLRQMTDAIRHRGPDGEGFFTDGAVGLGHRRLAIIDLTPAGHQPMLTGDGRFALVYNGEVYNFQELRAELEAHGHHFRSRTDSEVVLRAFEQWGERCVERFNGMFAFAIWDRDRRELFLARDRYGIKPLYYAMCGETFLFGSEVKAILAHTQVRAGIDLPSLLEYMTFQNSLTDRTLFKDVRLLPPATWLTISLDRPHPRQHRYWDFHFTDGADCGDETEYLDEFDRLFRQAVERQLVSDVDVGAYLSGGMDSGSITALAASRLPNMKTFTCGFDLRSASGLELSFDERASAEYMSYLFKTEHYEVVLKAGDMENVMSRLTWHLEEPRIGQSYPNFYVAQLASRFVKVALSGAGGDELFGGYPWRYYRALVNTSFDDYVDKYYLYWQRLVPNRTLKDLFRPVWAEVQHVWTRDIFRSVFQNPQDELRRPEDYVNFSLYFEAKTFLHSLLVVDDKLSMAHGLETRVPFLDNDLVSFAMNVPVRLKLAKLAEVIRLDENEPGPKGEHFYQRSNDGKLLMRRAMRRYVPDEIVSRQKQGFSAPDASWFKGESIDYVKRRLLARQARIFEYLDRETVHRLVGEHLNGVQNRRLLIWSLLSLESWCETFLDTPS